MDAVVAIHALNAGINANTSYEYVDDETHYGTLLHKSDTVGMDERGVYLPASIQKKKERIGGLENTETDIDNNIKYSEAEKIWYNQKLDELFENPEYDWWVKIWDRDELKSIKEELLLNETAIQDRNLIEIRKKLEDNEFELRFISLVSSYERNVKKSTLGIKYEILTDPLLQLLKKKNIGVYVKKTFFSLLRALNE
jgi:DNA-dependent RNA polymerase auxiliary subunit epsilon